jgi:broad specificity phosphatase PhoE
MVEPNGADRLVVVTHATIIRLRVAGLLGLPVNRYRALLARPDHLSWTELEAAHDGWMLVTYGAPLAALETVRTPGTGAP